MNISVTELPGSRVEVKSELAAESFNSFIEKTTKRFVNEAELPGFRKGKAPENLVVQKIGEDKILQATAEEALRVEWPKVLAEKNIDAVGPAEFHILKLARGNPLEWKAAVAVIPRVVLPDYKNIAHEINQKKSNTALDISDKEVDETLAYIQKARLAQGAALPPLDDAYAKSIGNFPSLAALKENIREGIRQEKAAKEKEAHHLKILEAIAEKVSIEIPAVMIEAEREKMLNELHSSIEDMGLKWNDYLTHIKKTEDELKKSWEEDAKKRVRTGLVLREIAKTEKIEPNQKEIEERAEFLLRPYSPVERKNLDQTRIRDYAYGIVRNGKVCEILETC